jgi:indolepyruvate ferredoxin oxidoreductase beta subunit
MYDQTVNIRLATVGGQGGVLASSILAQVAFDSGLDVKKREVHGMSQRGGVVTSDVRFGRNVFSPMVPQGSVDYLLAFEQAEALRAIPDLKETGVAIVNTQVIIPPIVAVGKAAYPDNPLGSVNGFTKNLFAFDAFEAAKAAGSVKTVSTVMLGALSRFLQFSDDAWLKAIRGKVPKKTIEINERAFLSGKEATGAVRS